MTNSVAHDHVSKLIAARSLPQPLEIKVPFTDEDEDAGAPAKPQPQKGGKPGGKKGGKKEKVKEYVLTIKFVQELEMQSLLKYVHQLLYLCDDMGRYKASEGSIHAIRSGPSVFSPQTWVSSRDRLRSFFSSFVVAVFRGLHFCYLRHAVALLYLYSRSYFFLKLSIWSSTVPWL